MNPVSHSDGARSDVKADSRFFERIITQYNTQTPSRSREHGPLRDGRSSEVFRTLYGESHRRSMIIEELQAFMGLLILTELWLHLV
jgi:hypothetical protein